MFIRVVFAMFIFINFVNHVNHVNYLGAEEIRTIFDSDDTNESIFGGNGGPFVYANYMNDSWGAIVGGKGGVIYNQTFAFGGIGMAHLGKHRFKGSDLGNPATNVNIDIAMGAGGLYFEYIYNLANPIHFSLPLNVMAGGVQLKNGGDSIETSPFFALEPGLTLAVNIKRSFIISVVTGYRFIFGTSLSNLEDSDLWGPYFGLYFSWGKFW